MYKYVSNLRRNSVLTVGHYSIFTITLNLHTACNYLFYFTLPTLI